MNISTRTLTIAIVGAMLAGGRIDAHFTSQFNSLTSYWFRVYHVPDLDQIRDDLVEDGREYCVPTSGIDWVGYFANHGASVMPGPANWEAQANYNLGTFVIASMSDCTYMCTDTDGDGTTVTDSVNGLRTWLGNAWVVSAWLRNQNSSPSFGLMATQALNGGYLIPGIGWYHPGNPCLDRDGGHAFAVTGMVRGDDLMIMYIHDPATPQIVDSYQSPFTTESYVCVPEQRNPDCGEPGWQTREMYRVVGLTRDDGSKLGYIDYVRAIFPQFALADRGPGEMTYVALDLHGGIQPLRVFMSANGQPILDAEPSVDLGRSIVITGTPEPGSPRELWIHTPGFERWEQVFIEGEAFSDVAVGRHGEAYVVDGGLRLICFGVDTREVEAEVDLPAFAEAVTYDDVSDEVVLLSTGEHVIMRYARGLEGPPALQFFDDLPVGEDASLAWDPTDGALWSIVDGDSFVYRITGGAGPLVVEAIDLPGVVAPQAIDVSDLGRLFVSDEGVIKEFVQADRKYQSPADPFFAGREAGRVLAVARSRTNYEPDLVDDSWFDQIPSEFAEGVPDCRADVDGDGLVSVTDLLLLLAAWGTADPFADMAPDGGDLNVDVLDLLELLAAWGPC
jgi:hypothetical protein